MPGFGKMDADLIAPASFELHFEDRVEATGGDGAVVRDGLLPFGGIGDAPHTKVAIFGKDGAEGSGRLAQLPLDDRDINAFDVVRGK